MKEEQFTVVADGGEEWKIEMTAKVRWGHGVNEVKNAVFDMLRKLGFNVSDIKIS